MIRDRYEDGKARTATRGTVGDPVVFPKTKCFKMRIFAKDGDVSNSNLVPFTEAIL